MDVLLHTAPGEVVGLATALQHAPPQPAHCLPEEVDACAVVGHAEVPHVSSNDRAQVSTLLRDGQMHAASELLIELLQLGLHPLSHRLPQHREPTLPRLSATVREAEEVEGAGLRAVPIAPFPVSLSAERDKTRLLGVQFESELRE